MYIYIYIISKGKPALVTLVLSLIMNDAGGGCCAREIRCHDEGAFLMHLYKRILGWGVHSKYPVQVDPYYHDFGGFILVRFITQTPNCQKCGVTRWVNPRNTSRLSRSVCLCIQIDRDV